MPTGHKIALFGYGSIGRLVYSGTANLSYVNRARCGQDKAFKSAISALTDVIENRNYTTLVNSYRKMQQKYYPERDVFKKGT